MTVTLRDLNNGSKSVKAETIENLSAALRGVVIKPGEAGYDDTRALWNGMIDCKPGLVIRAVGIGDILVADNFARDNGLLMAVLGGGHQIAGQGMTMPDS